MAHAAYARLVRESDHLFTLITQARPPTRVFFSLCTTPYRDADELITSITRDRILEVTAVACERDRLHPVMGCEVGGAYDRFRAVHDILGHGHLNVGFGREGEYAAGATRSASTVRSPASPWPPSCTRSTVCAGRLAGFPSTRQLSSTNG